MIIENSSGTPEFSYQSQHHMAHDNHRHLETITCHFGQHLEGTKCMPCRHAFSSTDNPNYTEIKSPMSHDVFVSVKKVEAKKNWEQNHTINS